jgi:hypothetical protein
MGGQNDMKLTKIDFVKCSSWQLVFLQSKVNGALYRGEQLPRLRWDWPKDTYLQRRLIRTGNYEEKWQWN